MPCVKIPRHHMRGITGALPHDCLVLDSQSPGGRFPLVRQTVITDPRYLMSGASRWDLSREQTHSAGLSHTVCVCVRGERERERTGRKHETRDIRALVKAWVRVDAVHVFSVYMSVCRSVFMCVNACVCIPVTKNTSISLTVRRGDLIHGGG